MGAVLFLGLPAGRASAGTPVLATASFLGERYMGFGKFVFVLVCAALVTFVVLQPV